MPNRKCPRLRDITIYRHMKLQKYHRSVSCWPSFQWLRAFKPPFGAVTHLPFYLLCSRLRRLVKPLFELGAWTSLDHEGLTEFVSLETFGDVSFNEEFVGIFVKFFRCQFVGILFWRWNDFDVQLIAVNRALSGWESGFSLVRSFVDSVGSKACTHWKCDIL